MEIQCKALDRPIDRAGCASARKELPKKFCNGCEWFIPETTEPIPNIKSKYVSGYTPSTYTIRLSNKLKIKLIEEAKKKNLQPREYIVKFLAEKLLK